jgi:hypothetical protein
MASAASHDEIPMAVGAVMALQSVDRPTATTMLNGAADHFRIPVSAVAHALLTLMAGTDELIGEAAGRAAAQVLVQDFWPSP